MTQTTDSNFKYWKKQVVQRFYDTRTKNLYDSNNRFIWPGKQIYDPNVSGDYKTCNLGPRILLSKSEKYVVLAIETYRHRSSKLAIPLSKS
jgi:hypothetical protein